MFEHTIIEQPATSTSRPIAGARLRSTVDLVLQLLEHVRPHRRYALLTMGFGVLGFLLSFAYPWIIGSVVDLMTDAVSGRATAETPKRLVHLTELAALTAVMHAIVVYGRGHFNIHLGDGIVTDLRQRLFDHLQLLSLRFYTKERTGSILSRVLNDVQSATAIIYMGIIVAAMDAVQLVIALGLLLSINWKLTIACTVVFPLYALVFAVTNPRVRSVSERVNAQLQRISGNITEQLTGQALIKTFAAEKREAERFRRDVTHHHRLVVAQSHQGHVVAGSSEVLVHLGTTIVVGYGGWLALHGEMTAGMMTRFLGYVLLMYGPVRRFAELNITYQSSLSAIRRVFRVFEIRPAVVEPVRPYSVPPARGEVRFEAVRFRYDDGSDESRIRLEEDAPDAVHDAADSRWVIDGVTLHAKPGERVALVGPSGAGKTTLVNLLPRLYDVTDGCILLDGVDVRDYSLTTLRSAVGIVQQDSFVFTGTIRDNIAYGRPDATDREVIEAARAAHLHDFVSSLPDGYLTRLGERGVNLSGGQRQRVAIARALLKDPRILILDEATSSLDAESEAVVQEALDRLMRGRTCFVIAHRLSTIHNADTIFILEAGRVTDCGSHADLLGRNGIYARLVRHQTFGLAG